MTLTINIDSSASDVRKALAEAERRKLPADDIKWYRNRLADAEQRECRRGFSQRTVDALHAFFIEWVRDDGTYPQWKR